MEHAPPCVAAAPLDTAVHDTSEVSSTPRLRAYPQLHYPDRARALHMSGRVTVRAIIGVDGIAEPASVSAIGGFDAELNAEAARFVRTARYWPGCLDGRPVRVRITEPVGFKIIDH